MDAWNQLDIILGAARQRERSLEGKLREQAEQIHALETVMATLVASMRWRGLNRSKFKMLMTEIARQTPSLGQTAARHEIYCRQSHRVLSTK